MANTLFSKGRELILTAGLDWSDAGIDINIALIKTSSGYSFSASDQFFSTVSNSGANVVGTPVALTTRTATNGAADADDATFTSVTGAAIGAIVIYQDTGDPATSTNLAYIDTASGLPITPNGGDIVVVFDNGTNKIFRI